MLAIIAFPKTMITVRNFIKHLSNFLTIKLNFDLTLDTTRAETELGYQPIVTLDEGIRRTALWLKDHGTLHRG